MHHMPELIGSLARESKLGGAARGRDCERRAPDCHASASADAELGFGLVRFALATRTRVMCDVAA